MGRTGKLYLDAVDISRDYLGPAGERFMRRQISTHLNKEPETLLKGDIPHLITWIRPTLALLTTDTKLIDTFIERLSGLAGKDHDAGQIRP